MGSWGTGLYQNDTGSDVKEVFSDLSRRPLDTEALVAEVLKVLQLSPDRMDEDAADATLALADQLHQYALDHPETMARARKLIESGADLDIKRDLEMSERDLKKREKVLAEALERWSQPHPKPKKRKVPKAPEPFLLEIGDVWSYPTMRHAARPFQVKDADLSQFEPDGWGAFIVADRWHVNGHRACYLIALAIPEGTDSPTLSHVVAAPVQQCTLTMSAYGEEKVYPMIFEARLSKRQQGMRKWPAEKLGTLAVDAGKLRELPQNGVRTSYNALDADGIAWLEDELTVSSFHKDASNARTGLNWRIAPHPTLRVSDFAKAN